MFVEITIRVDGREVGNFEQHLSGTAAEMEEQTRQFNQRIQRVILERGFDEIARHVRRPVCCGKPMENRGRRRITVQCLSGEIVLERTRYRCQVCWRELTPADAEVCLGRHRVTKPLAKRVCQLATIEHFTRLEQLLADQHGVNLGHEEILELVHEAGDAAERLRRAEAQNWHDRPTAQRRWPEPDVSPARVYVSCDGIMYCTNQSEPDPHHPGRQRLIWQQMKVGCVYWQDVSGRWQKQMIWGREGPEEFGISLFRLACRCGYRQASEKIFAADGADWCWEIQARYFGDATGILDWYHASEHIWTAAHALFSDTESARSWADEALSCLREQGGRGLYTWLHNQQRLQRGRRRKTTTQLLNYVQPRRSRMDYQNYRGAGWQIGTGMMESTAKQLVGVRLKGPGMHWTERGALAVTALRAQDLNGRWRTFWDSLVIAT